jgi:hypothetical protein
MVAIVDVAARMVVPIPPDQSPFGEEWIAVSIVRNTT